MGGSRQFASQKPQAESSVQAKPTPKRSAPLLEFPMEQVRIAQSIVGNQGVLRRMESGLRVNDVNDPAEREADQVASAVMAASGSDPKILSSSRSHSVAVQRECAQCEQDERVHLQRKESSLAQSEAVPSIVGQVLNSEGRPLDQITRGYMESRFRHDFSHVRVHDDERAADSARSVNAKAYTVGNHLVFAEGRYAPRSQEGKHLLAHELAHVVQQSREKSVHAIQRSPLTADEIGHLSQSLLEQRLLENELESEDEKDESKLQVLAKENLQLKAAISPRPQPVRPSGDLPLVALRDITPDEARAFSDSALAGALGAGRRWLNAYPTPNANASPPADYQRAVQSMLVLEQEDVRRRDDVQRELAQAEQVHAAADARQAEKFRQAKEQFQKDYELSQRIPGFWSLFDPTIDRNPSRQIQNPLLRFQSETTNAAVRGHAQVVGATAAVAAGVAAGVVVLAMGGLALSATASLVADAAVATPGIARTYVLVARLSIESPHLVDFVAGQVLKIALGGGIVAFLKSPSAEGGLELIHDVLFAYTAVPRGGTGGGSGRGSFTGHVEGSDGEELIVRIIRGPNTPANDNAIFPKVPASLHGGTAANDVVPVPQPARVAVASGLDFSEGDELTQPTVGATSQQGDRTLPAPATSPGVGSTAPKLPTEALPEPKPTVKAPSASPQAEPAPSGKAGATGTQQDLTEPEPLERPKATEVRKEPDVKRKPEAKKEPEGKKEPEAKKETEKAAEKPAESAKEQTQKRLDEIRTEKALFDDEIRDKYEKKAAAQERSNDAAAKIVNAAEADKPALRDKRDRNKATADRLQNEIEQLRLRRNALAAQEARLVPRVVQPQTWQEAEDALRKEFSGQKKTFVLRGENRDVDCFSADGISREGKFGPQGLTDFIQNEINKDVELRNAGAVKAVEWHFYENVDAGIGPSGPLADALRRAGIRIVLHK
jgi:hypothetical protein